MASFFEDMKDVGGGMSPAFGGGDGDGGGGGGGGRSGGGGAGGGGGGGPEVKNYYLTQHFAPGAIVLKADDVDTKEKVKKVFLELAGAEGLS